MGRRRGSRSWQIGCQGNPASCPASPTEVSSVAPAMIGYCRSMEGQINSLHAVGAGDGTHQPLVYAPGMVVVHTWEETDRITLVKINHADWTPVKW